MSFFGAVLKRGDALREAVASDLTFRDGAPWENRVRGGVRVTRDFRAQTRSSVDPEETELHQ